MPLRRTGFRIADSRSPFANREFAGLRTEFGTAVARVKNMKVLTEYGRIAGIYLSFVAFLATEVFLIVGIYRYLGIW